MALHEMPNSVFESVVGNNYVALLHALIEEIKKNRQPWVAFHNYLINLAPSESFKRIHFIDPNVTNHQALIEINHRYQRLLYAYGFQLSFNGHQELLELAMTHLTSKLATLVQGVSAFQKTKLSA